MHDTPNELFGTKKKPPKQQTRKPQQKPANIWVGSRSRATAALVPGAVLPPPGGSGDGPSQWPQDFASFRSTKIGTNFTDSLRKFLFKFLISAPSERKYFSGEKKKQKAVTEGKHLWSVWISADSVQHLFPLSAFPCASYRPTVRGIRSSCVHSSHASAKLPGTEVEQELQSFHHCPLVTFLKNSVRNSSLPRNSKMLSAK